MTVTVRKLHRWDLDYGDMRRTQERLCGRLERSPLALRRVKHVAGADIAISKRLDRMVAAVVVMSLPDLEVVETKMASARITIPYIPGLLSFREIPALIECFKKVWSPFDVIMCDGHGIAHPRGLGLASHLGLILGIPTVGCAKSRLVGEYDDPDTRRGSYARLTFKGRYVGSVLRTRDGVKPIFVSPGHRIDHPGSRRIALACLTRYRIPEPTRLADIAAGAEKRRLEQASDGTISSR